MKQEILIKREHEKYRTLKDLRHSLNLPEDIMVENVHLAESLMTLSYRIHSTEV